MQLYSYEELRLDEFKRTKSYPKYGGCTSYLYEDFICLVLIEENRHDKSKWELKVCSYTAYSRNARVIEKGLFNTPFEALKAAERTRQSIIEQVFKPYDTAKDQSTDSLSLLFQNSPIPKKMTL